MMLKLILSLALITLVFQDVNCTGCEILQRLKVKGQWSQAFGFTADRESLGKDVWTEIFHAKPDARTKFFTQVRGDNIFSPEFRAHSARVLAGFDMALSLLDDQATLDSQLAHLKQQHIALDVGAEYFDVFNTALIVAVQKRIGRCYDFDAWKSCTAEISAGIKH